MSALPGIELHLDLGGAAPAAVLRDLAARRRRHLSGLLDGAGGGRPVDPAGLLRARAAVASAVDGPEDHARLLSAVLQDLGAEGVAYAEIRVTPAWCGGGDLSAWRDHVAAWSDTAAVLEGQGIFSRGVVLAPRHMGEDRARRAAICAAETAGEGGGGWIAGFGLSGPDAAGRATEFAWAFDCAREAGLGLTCDAAGPLALRDALGLGVTRIGHGSGAAENRDVLRELVDRGVTLECCPGADVALGLVSGWAGHPIAVLADAGCRVTLSSDSPALLGLPRGRVLDRLADAFGWGEAEFARLSHWALDAAFCDDSLRERLRARLPVLS